MTLSYRQLSFFRPALLLVVCALAGVTTLWWPRPGLAQRDTGIMVVHATDPDGAPLPGAMVVAQVRTVDARGEGNVVGSERPQREAFVTIIDVRAEKQVTIGRYGVLHFYVDVFNLFNSNVVTKFEWTLGRRYGEITDILPPRVIRIGGAWDF